MTTMTRGLGLMLFVLVLLGLSGPAQAAVWEWNEAGYERQEATGFLRNTTGLYQGPGAATGMTYGPLGRVKLDTGFTLAEVGKWYGGFGSRLGGDTAPEGSKMSLTVGAAPLTVMWVSFVAGYNLMDGALVWGAVTSLNGLWDRLNK